MPVAAADLIAWSPANVPEDDTSTTGGARSTTSRPALDQWSANAVAAVVSDGADVRTATVTGRLTSGAIDTEVLTLNGAVEVVGAKTWERVLKVVLSGTDASRTVIVRQGSAGTTRATIGPNELTRHIFFQRSASEAGAVSRYELLYWRNHHVSLSLNSAKVTLTADPAARIKIGLGAAKGDLGTVANRKSAPAGVTFSDDGVELSVPTGALAASEHIGTWVEQALIANDTAKRQSYTTRLSGTTVA